MIALRSPVQAGLKGHKKQGSTDSINSQQKRRFLSVVSSETIAPKPAHQLHQRKTSELRKQAMGEITNRHDQPRGIQLKIKRASANFNNDKVQERGVSERMVLFKQRLANLTGLDDSATSK
jgi:ribosomal protein L2